jgi:hypothetical protein
MRNDSILKSYAPDFMELQKYRISLLHKSCNWFIRKVLLIALYIQHFLTYLMAVIWCRDWKSIFCASTREIWMFCDEFNRILILIETKVYARLFYSVLWKLMHSYARKEHSKCACRSRKTENKTISDRSRQEESLKQASKSWHGKILAILDDYVSALECGKTIVIRCKT